MAKTGLKLAPLNRKYIVTHMLLLEWANRTITDKKKKKKQYMNYHIFF